MANNIGVLKDWGIHNGSWRILNNMGGEYDKWLAKNPNVNSSELRSQKIKLQYGDVTYTVSESKEITQQQIDNFFTLANNYVECKNNIITIKDSLPKEHLAFFKKVALYLQKELAEKLEKELQIKNAFEITMNYVLKGKNKYLEILKNPLLALGDYTDSNYAKPSKKWFS